VWSDHKNLEYFRKPQNINHQQAYWVSLLADYGFSLHHLPGSHNSAADALSCQPNHDDGSGDNTEVIVLKEAYFEVQATEDVSTLEAQVRTAQDTREPIIVKSLAKRPGQWRVDDKGVVWVKDQLYVPKDNVLRGEILRAHHDSPLAGHPGCHGTQNLVERAFFWPSLSCDVHRYVNCCAACQENKMSQLPTSTALHSHTPPSQPWDVISVDLVGPLPTSKDHDAILNIVDHFSKMVIAVPTSITLMSSELANIYKEKVFPFFGIPKKIVSDRGPQFASEFTHDICRILGIEQNLSTAYHPETNAQVERMNHEVAQYLQMYVNYHQDGWSDWLPLAQFALNNQVSTSTGESPFYLNHGRHPHMPHIRDVHVKKEGAAQFGERLRRTRKEAEEAMKWALWVSGESFNRSVHPTVRFKPGDLVYIEGTKIKNTQPLNKLAQCRYGLFEVIRQVNETSYELKLPDTWRLKHPVFHRNLLSKHQTGHSPQQLSIPHNPPLLLDDDGERVYDVETIANSQRAGKAKGGVEYLVKWLDYGEKENTWEPGIDLDNPHVCELINTFHRTHLSAFRPGRGAGQ